MSDRVYHSSRLTVCTYRYDNQPSVALATVVDVLSCRRLRRGEMRLCFDLGNEHFNEFKLFVVYLCELFNFFLSL